MITRAWMTLLLFASLGSTLAQPLEDPPIRPERTEWRETSRYQDVIDFLEAVVPKSDKLHLRTFGYTNEGRALPLVIAGPTDSPTPESIRSRGDTRVFIQANIHAGEVCGKEALQQLVRDLAGGQFSHWFDHLTLLIAPIYNADGNERIALTNRPGQHGPIGGMGQRPNAQDLDLNRDHMKVESPEARCLIRLFQEYDPHVIVDLHTTNGTVHGYHLTYSPPLHPNTPAAIDQLLREAWLPKMTQKIRERDGWEFYYYGNLGGRGEARGWYTFDHRPRFNNNYAGLRNRFGILSEAYSYATFEERVIASKHFVEEICEYAATHAREIRQITAAADAQDLIDQELAVRAQHARSPEKVTILLGGAETEPNPYSGARMRRRTEERRPEEMYEYGTFEATVTETVPAAYFVPGRLRAVRERLDAHGVVYRELKEDWTGEAETFAITSTETAEREFQGHNERTLEGSWQAAGVETVPAGTLVVPMNQPLARLTFSLLEPRSDDGLAAWNVLDNALREASSYPILRSRDRAVLGATEGAGQR
ncbi:MAG: M14 family metallopeptidase [Planctomycetota bacterium]